MTEHQPPKRPRPLGIFATALALLAAGTIVMAGSAVADETFAGSLWAHGDNGVVYGDCQFTVTSVDYDAGTVTARITAHAEPVFKDPKDVQHYVKIVHNRIECWLTPAGSSNRLVTVIADGDSAFVGTPLRDEENLYTVPQHNGYAICEYAEATLKGGAQSTTDTFCATSG